MLDRLLVVSPHLDDAVLGAGELIASYRDTTVVTVFAGTPSRYPEHPTTWDAASGFGAGDDVVEVRRSEDRAAMDVLGAAPRWLEFVDHQYIAPHDRPKAVDVAGALVALVAEVRATAVFFPMGLANPDHILSHEAGLLARSALQGTPDAPAWFCYEDAGYAHIPGLLARRVARLLRSSVWPTPAPVPVLRDPTRKRAAIANYRSQLRPLQAGHALDDRRATERPEHLWRLAPPPRGWEGLAWDV